MTSKVGIKKNGNKAKEASREKFVQLNDMDIFLPIKKNKLSKKQKNNSLRAISVVREKRDGKIKGRVCADGRKQLQWYDEQQTALLTVRDDSFMLTTAAEAKEGRHNATAKIKGVCLYVEQDDFTVNNFFEEKVDEMCLI